MSNLTEKTNYPEFLLIRLTKLNMDDNTNRPRWPDFFLIIFVPIIGMALGVGVTIFLNIGQTDYSSLIVNLFFLTACSAVLATFKFSREDLGLKSSKANYNGTYSSHW